MFRNRGEGEGKRVGKVADSRFARGQAIEERPAGGVGKRLEHAIEVLFNHKVEFKLPHIEIQPNS